MTESGEVGGMKVALQGVTATPVRSEMCSMRPLPKIRRRRCKGGEYAIARWVWWARKIKEFVRWKTRLPG